MARIKASDNINQDRRRFLSAAAMTVAAAELLKAGSAEARTAGGN
jgi:hypothetical protein